MLRCDDDDGCCHPPDRSVTIAVVGVLGAVAAAVAPELVKWWRESREERLGMERQIGFLAGKVDGGGSGDEESSE